MLPSLGVCCCALRARLQSVVVALRALESSKLTCEGVSGAVLAATTFPTKNETITATYFTWLSFRVFQLYEGVGRIFFCNSSLDCYSQDLLESLLEALLALQTRSIPLLLYCSSSDGGKDVRIVHLISLLLPRCVFPR